MKTMNKGEGAAASTLCNRLFYQINQEMKRLLNKINGTGPCRSHPFAAAILAMMLAFLFMPSGSLAGSMPVDDNSVMKRAMEAGIDAGRIERLASRAQEREMTPDQLQQMLMTVIALAEMDLPYHLVMQKAGEGLAKQIPAPGILLVLDHMHSSMVRSVAIVDPWMRRQEVQDMIEMTRGSRSVDEVTKRYRDMLLESTSHSLQNNTDDGTLLGFLDKVASTIVKNQGDMESIAAGLQVLSEMSMTQDNPGLSVRLVLGAMNAGFTATQIRELPHALRSGYSSHLPIEKITGSVDMQMYENIPAIHVMESLFQGNIGSGPAGFHVPDVHRDGESDRGRDRRPPLPPLP